MTMMYGQSLVVSVKFVSYHYSHHYHHHQNAWVVEACCANLVCRECPLLTARSHS